MAGFRFRFDTVLEQRRQDERERQGAVAQMERDRVAVERRAREVEQRIADERGRLSELLGASGGGGDGAGGGGRADVGAARWQAASSIHLMSEAQRLAIELAGVRARLDRARADLREASVRRKAMEELRERALATWREEAGRREEAMLDEISIARESRRAFDRRESVGEAA